MAGEGRSAADNMTEVQSTGSRKRSRGGGETYFISYYLTLDIGSSEFVLPVNILRKLDGAAAVASRQPSHGAGGWGRLVE